MTARDPNPHPAPANSNDDWQDWPPDSSAGDPRSEASLWLAKWPDKGIARGGVGISERPLASASMRQGRRRA
jgi:hypothetical protein